jgi:PAS domain S-box-containing protein
LTRWRTALATAAGGLVAAIGVTALAGWAAGSQVLIRPLRTLPVIPPLSAAALAALGAALLLLVPYHPSWYRRSLAVILSVAVAAVGVIVLGEYLTGSRTGLDTLMFPHEVKVLMGGKFAGQPSPQSAVTFVATGLALALLDARRWRWVPMVLAPAAGLIALVAVFGYLYGVGYLRGTSDISGMSVVTAIALIIVSVGVLCVRPQRPPVTWFTSHRPSGVLARRLFPVLLLLPFLTGLLNLAGINSGTRDAAATVTVTTSVVIVLLIAAMIATMHVLDRSDEIVHSQQEHLDTVISTANDGFISIDARGAISEWNQQAEQIFGWPRAEAIGRDVAEMIIPPRMREAHRAGLRRVAQGGPPHMIGTRKEMTGLHRDGRELPVEVALSRTGSGPSLQFHAFIHEITERLALQAERERARSLAERQRYSERLERAQRLDSLGQLVGGVAHNFNNLFAIIQNYGTFVAEELMIGRGGGCQHCDAALDDLKEAQQASERAAQLTRHLMTMGRRDAAQPAILDINGVAAEIGSLLGGTLRENIQLATRLDPGLRPVVADARQLQQALLNLAVNSRDAMPTGGTLTIETVNVDLGADNASGLPPGAYVQISVTDTGAGMPREIADRAFEPFYTTGSLAESFGLGLAMVHAIITRAGGDVQLESEPGIGTTVRMLLPAARTAVQEATVAANGSAPPRPVINSAGA